MHCFQDSLGRLWHLVIPPGALKRASLETLTKIVSDPVHLVDMLFVGCRLEADRRGITAEDFGRAIGGDSLRHAGEAFLAALIDSEGDDQRRAALYALAAKWRASPDALADKPKAVAAVTPEEALRVLEEMASKMP
jgi:hypothetical protein